MGALVPREVFWRTAGAIRDAGYGSILSLIQEAVTAQSPVPMLTREGGPESRGTKHLRILIPKGINGTFHDAMMMRRIIIMASWNVRGQLSKHG
jgi:hypothetical protein